MYVKNLTLKGFKSFAEPVSLDLQSGVNVVVGPNGSGKSNVIDAVAWVLGAQGAKSLRGGKMDDVIFAGSSKRAALGRAEVSLTIDNSDRRIPVDFTEVTITRTLFRTGESEYAINGVGCRLLDIQELLSDSGVGRSQHVIVSQGNLGAILNARPEDRRMIVEEAAGVLKYRKRREKSQRRLEATEGNLDRLADLVREVRQQMRPLQKQAEAARRHGDVSSELRALRLFTAGRDVESLQHRADNAEAENAELLAQDERLRQSLTELDAAVVHAEAAVNEATTEDLSDRVERLERSLQRAKGAVALTAERRRSLERDLLAQASRDVISSLESDSVNVGRELEAVDEELEQLGQPFDDLGHREAHLGNEWLRFEEEWGEGLPASSNEAAQLRGESSALSKSIAGLTDDVARRRQRLEHLESQRNQAQDEARQHRDTGAELEASAPVLASNLETAQAAVDSAISAFEAAEDAVRNAEQRLSVARARAETLSNALESSRARAGVERLAGASGIAGTLPDLVEVDEGYSAAFEAAAGEALAAVVVESEDSARQALALLRASETDGAVLALGHDDDEFHGVPDEAGDAETLRSHVRSLRKDVEQLLDTVLCCCVVVDGDWERAVDFSLRYPDLVVVTKAGDRFARNGWRIGTGSAGATKAAVLVAESDAATIAGELEAMQERLNSLRSARQQAEAELASAVNAVTENERSAAANASALERLTSRIEGFSAEMQTIEEHLAGLVSRIDEETERLHEIEGRLPALEAAEASGEERVRLWREARSRLEAKSSELRRQRSELEVRSQALQERSTYLKDRLENLRTRLDQHRLEVEQAAERRVRIERSILILDRLGSMVRASLSSIESQLGEARDRRNAERERSRQASTHLEALRRSRASVERELLSNAERKSHFEVRRAEIRTRLEALLETLERELEVSVEEALAAPEPEIPSGKTAKGRIAELERDLRSMGPINPLALEEFQAIEERHEFLDKQLRDVQESRKDLLRVIRAVDAEIVEVFTNAYADVAKNFEHLFTRLFPGGSGRLWLTDPENPLETGIEIEAKPSGKNVRTLSLLSGGERSLAALAFLFAVFRSRPSPFYLLDEVEAALDDINLNRFLTLIEEFRSEAQLVIVSHQKRTMEAADCLYGVSMQPGGSSKVVSERVHVDLTSVSA